MSSVGGPYDSTNGQVPASVSTDGFDVSSSVAEAKARAEQYQKALTAAQVPVAQRTTPGLPSTMTRPIGPAPQTQGYAQPRSKGQAIANTITSAGNAVSKVVTAVKQQKQAQMVDVATKFLQARQLLSEAQQQHDAATAAGNKEAADAAQGQIEGSKAAIQAIISDPKHLKMLSEGLNINYIDPSENKTEAHTAVQKAVEGVHGWNEKRKAAEVARQQVQQKQQAEAPGKFLAAYDKQQPTQNTPNQYAQQQVAAMQAQQAKQMELVKLWAPFELEKNREAFEAANTQAKYVNDLAVENQKLANQRAERSADQGFQVKLLGQRLAGERDNMVQTVKLDVDKAQAMEVLAASDPSQITQAEINTDKITDEALAKFDARRDTLLASLNRFGIASDTLLSSDVKELIRSELEQNTKDRAARVELGNTYKLYYKNLKDKAIGKQGGTDGSAPGTGTGATPAAKNTDRAGSSSGSTSTINSAAHKALDFFESFLPKKPD